VLRNAGACHLARRARLDRLRCEARLRAHPRVRSVHRACDLCACAPAAGLRRQDPGANLADRRFDHHLPALRTSGDRNACRRTPACSFTTAKAAGNASSRGQGTAACSVHTARCRARPCKRGNAGSNSIGRGEAEQKRHPQASALRARGVHKDTRRNRSEFPTTLTDESAIAAAAMIGESRMPKNG